MIQSQDDNRLFDPFELSAAILLGIGAIATSVASHQNNLWGGQSVAAYGDAATMTSKATATFNNEQSTFNTDAEVERRAKELIWESQEVKDEVQSNRSSAMAAWMLLSQLSETAYKNLGLPEEVRKAYWEGSGDFRLTPEQLDTALEADLNQAYVAELFVDSSAEFDEADKRFAQGNDANSKGDQFSLAAVICTVALFFAGLSLVFKTRLRWGFLGLGTAVLVAGMGYMASLTWA